MKTQVKIVAAIAIGWAAAAWPQPPPSLTSVSAISALNNNSAQTSLPVSFEAAITYFRPYEQTMFVQDGDAVVFVLADTKTAFAPGDWVRIKGLTRAGLRPFVSSTDITLLHHGSLPPPIPATFSQLITAQYDCRRITIRGVVRTADQILHSDTRAGDHPVFKSGRLQVLTDGGVIEAFVDEEDERGLANLLDFEVDIEGVAGGRFDGKLQQTGVVIHVASVADVHILKSAKTDPWSLPVSPMHQIMSAYYVRDLSSRVRVHGTITYFEPNAAAVLQSGSKSIWVSTRRDTPMKVGDVADAVGFPDAHNGFLTLNLAEVEDRGIAAPIVPEKVTWSQLVESNKIFDLVSIEGQVVTENQQTGQDEYVIAAQGHLFTAIYRHSVGMRYVFDPVPQIRNVPIGSRVRVTGICVLQNSNPFTNRVPFAILLRSSEDMVVLAPPSPLNVRNLLVIAGLLMAIVLVVIARGWSLEHRVRRETTIAADVEKRRSEVLEDINRARPLAEIVAKITDLLSYKLQGAHSWCELAGGTIIGRRPEGAEAERLQIIERSIPSHSGKSLGTLFAAIDPRGRARKSGPEALFNATQLAALAIETGGLYSDLVHRSEFDLLTDIHNRFSLEKQFDRLIESERRADGTFGLVYIDLDDFKLVNDQYGHHVGDLYLQEAAMRMQRQLRPGDILARLGGDEFAALVPAVRNRSDVEEIAVRLERCFDEPFKLEGYSISGSASVGIALYPDDGTDRDSLLHVGDTAMYAAKNRRRNRDLASGG